MAGLSSKPSNALLFIWSALLQAETPTMGTRRVGWQLAASAELTEEQLSVGPMLELLCEVDAASMVRMCLVATSPSIVGMFTSCSTVKREDRA